MFFFDWTMILIIPAFLLALWAQGKVKSTYAKYSQVRSDAGMPGAEVARSILDRNGLHDVDVEEVQGELSDHYDPKSKTVRLSTGNYRNASLAGLAVAAHECGHAIQHARSYAPLAFRTAFFPAASLGSSLAIPLFFIGFLFSAGGSGGLTILMDIGILFFAAAVLFHMVTLPVEFDASKRALALLGSTGCLSKQEVGGARKVLNAAAWTYVAAASMAVLQLVRLLVLRGAVSD
ncbi:MAG: zinc metallopeptidase [bacterium]